MPAMYAKIAARPDKTNTRVIEQELRKWKHMIYRTKIDGNYSGMLIVSDGGLTFAKRNAFDQLLQYEQSIGQSPRERKWLEIICCYDEKTIARMPLRFLIPALKSHSHLLNRDWDGAGLNDYRILSMIEKGIDDILGRNAGKLFFSTLKLIYKIDEDKIIQQPELVEAKLQMMFGKSGDQILRGIEKWLRNEITSAKHLKSTIC